MPNDTDVHTDMAGTLAAWRARGAQGFEPVRFRFIEALARRSANHDGDARRLLDARLAGLLRDYTQRFERAQHEAAALPGAARPAGTAGPLGTAGPAARPGPLAELSRLLAQHSAEGGPNCAPGPAASVGAGAGAGVGAGSGAGALPSAMGEASHTAELRTLRDFKDTWSRLSVARRMTQSLAKEPENAGPLNSHVLALRSLRLMHDISPAYLSRFMSHVDTLMWLDQANGSTTPLQRDVVRGDDTDRKPRAGRRKAG